jgi:hypothetical protein
MINVLTPEQITTLEEAFSSYPDNYKKMKIYAQWRVFKGN